MEGQEQEKEMGIQSSPQPHISNDDTRSLSSKSSDLVPSSITEQHKSRKWQGWIWSFLKLVASQWFLISLGLVILLASQVQVPEKHQQLKATLVSYLCISIIFFLTGCTLNTQILLENYSRWKLHLWVQILCYLGFSSVVFAVVSLCAMNRNFMDPGLLLGFILTGCTPTTISSNVVMTGNAHGNKALTVVQSTLGNFLGPFLTPVIFTMYTSSGAWYTTALPTEHGGYGEIYRRVFKQLGLSLFVPMFVGQLVQNFFPKLNQRYIVGYKISKISTFCLLVVVWQVYDQAFASHAFDTVKPSNMIFVVFFSVALYFIVNAISFFGSRLWLSKEDVISVCYCVPAKSPAMGVPLAMTMFVGLTPELQAKLQIPMVIYQGLQIVGGTIFVVPFKRWVDGPPGLDRHDEEVANTA
ncbi:sodium bile acid symporter family protein [Microthyrium microscopicum]|uniref:Sodium bile acid symporter family protein n=1 Tax=Microthyrium microscopicum TaxID=703497 RepID=A0A6A6TZI4_9PEZI|nr:sodium bile acid symporter family protein [Microthyrium microscopicum]